MQVTIRKSTAVGTVTVPPSKSLAHRYLICAALANGTSVISGVDYSEDILATLDCIRALRATVKTEGDRVTVTGTESMPAHAEFPCRESGSTMRFFMGIAIVFGLDADFFGSETLRNRPFGVYEDVCREYGIGFERLPDRIHIAGPAGADGRKDRISTSGKRIADGSEERRSASEMRIDDGSEETLRFRIPGNVSSQFITGLLFGLPCLSRDSIIELLPPVESRSYLKLTESALADFGVTVDFSEETQIRIPGNQSYCPAQRTVEGDYSNAAFPEALNLFGGNVKLCGLRDDSLQGDRVYRECFRQLQNGKPEIDITDCPDLGPVLMAVAAAKHGAVLTGTKRLKMKESDRGTVMCRELSAFGIRTVAEENRIEVFGGGLKRPEAPVFGHNDHRIVMALSILLTLVGGTIDGAEAVAKSYPHFFDDLQRLGIEVIRHGMD